MNPTSPQNLFLKGFPNIIILTNRSSLFHISESKNSHCYESAMLPVKHRMPSDKQKMLSVKHRMSSVKHRMTSFFYRMPSDKHRMESDFYRMASYNYRIPSGLQILLLNSDNRQLQCCNFNYKTKNIYLTLKKFERL